MRKWGNVSLAGVALLSATISGSETQLSIFKYPAQRNRKRREAWRLSDANVLSQACIWRFKPTCIGECWMTRYRVFIACCCGAKLEIEKWSCLSRRCALCFSAANVLLTVARRWLSDMPYVWLWSKFLNWANFVYFCKTFATYVNSPRLT